jgi:tellurite methyltransferase
MECPMSDRKHWNEKYRQSAFLGESSAFLQECLPFLPRGRALDVACGLGRNALRLGDAGFEVEALDWSFEAARKLLAAARHRGVPVRPAVCDLTRYPIPRERYDVVLAIRFLDPARWPALVDALKPGGALVVETFNTRHLARDPDFRREFCVDVGELLTAFGTTLTVARYRELPSETTTSLLAFRGSRAGR